MAGDPRNPIIQQQLRGVPGVQHLIQVRGIRGRAPQKTVPEGAAAPYGGFGRYPLAARPQHATVFTQTVHPPADDVDPDPKTEPPPRADAWSSTEGSQPDARVPDVQTAQDTFLQKVADWFGSTPHPSADEKDALSARAARLGIPPERLEALRRSSTSRARGTQTIPSRHVDRGTSPSPLPDTVDQGTSPPPRTALVDDGTSTYLDGGEGLYPSVGVPPVLPPTASLGPPPASPPMHVRDLRPAPRVPTVPTVPTVSVFRPFGVPELPPDALLRGHEPVAFFPGPQTGYVTPGGTAASGGPSTGGTSTGSEPLDVRDLDPPPPRAAPPRPSAPPPFRPLGVPPLPTRAFLPGRHAGYATRPTGMPMVGPLPSYVAAELRAPFTRHAWGSVAAAREVMAATSNGFVARVASGRMSRSVVSSGGGDAPDAGGASTEGESPLPPSRIPVSVRGGTPISVASQSSGPISVASRSGGGPPSRIPLSVQRLAPGTVHARTASDRGRHDPSKRPRYGARSSSLSDPPAAPTASSIHMERLAPGAKHSIGSSAASQGDRQRVRVGPSPHSLVEVTPAAEAGPSGHGSAIGRDRHRRRATFRRMAAKLRDPPERPHRKTTPATLVGISRTTEPNITREYVQRHIKRARGRGGG